MSVRTPILFCIFNRPKLTEQVFAQIAYAQPQQLYVISDGPRDEEEAAVVKQTREILNRVDWNCEVITHFSEVNLGCAQRMASGIEWAFEQSDELIILEDDCLPSNTFFSYCDQLLERYRDDPRIGMISGDNFQPNPTSNNSYYFSRWPHIWGWASWKRAWQYFELNVPPQLDPNVVAQFESAEEAAFWESAFGQIQRGELDTWDFSWTYSFWRENLLAILPERNLVSNLGFGVSATHTVDANSKLANLKRFEIETLHHPERVERNVSADRYTWEKIMAPPKPVPAISKKRRWYQSFLKTG